MRRVDRDCSIRSETWNVNAPYRRWDRSESTDSRNNQGRNSWAKAEAAEVVAEAAAVAGAPVADFRDGRARREIRPVEVGLTHPQVALRAAVAPAQVVAVQGTAGRGTVAQAVVVRAADRVV